MLVSAGAALVLVLANKNAPIWSDRHNHRGRRYGARQTDGKVSIVSGRKSDAALPILDTCCTVPYIHTQYIHTQYIHTQYIHTQYIHTQYIHTQCIVLE